MDCVDGAAIWRASQSRRLILGKLLLFGALFCIGAISVVTGDFAFNWQPVPADLPGRPVFARLLGTLLVIGAAGAIGIKTTRIAINFLGVVLLFWLVVLQGFRLVTAPLLAGAWSAFSEVGTLTIATWLLAAPSENTPPKVWRIYGLFPCLFGVAHFVFADITAGFVPGWIPHHLFWVYATGTLHFIGGVMIIAGVLPELAAAGLGLMYLSWVLILHAPRVLEAPGSRFEWSMLLFASAIAGSAFVMSSANAFGRTPRLRASDGS